MEQNRKSLFERYLELKTIYFVLSICFACIIASALAFYLCSDPIFALIAPFVVLHVLLAFILAGIGGPY